MAIILFFKMHAFAKYTTYFQSGIVNITYCRLSLLNATRKKLFFVIYLGCLCERISVSFFAKCVIYAPIQKVLAANSFPKDPDGARMHSMKFVARPTVRCGIGNVNLKNLAQLYKHCV